MRDRKASASTSTQVLTDTVSMPASDINYKELGVRTQSPQSQPLPKEVPHHPYCVPLSFLLHLTPLKAESLVPMPLRWEHSLYQLWLCLFLMTTTICKCREVTIGTTSHSPQTFAQKRNCMSGAGKRRKRSSKLEASPKFSISQSLVAITLNHLECLLKVHIPELPLDVSN